MEIAGFDWDEANAPKCTKHGVSIAEIESLFERRVLILDDPNNAQIERRFRAIGIGSSGRHMFVAFTWRGCLIRPISARYMHQREIDRYEKDNTDL